MDREQLTRVNQAFDVIEQDALSYSDAVKEKVKGLSEEERKSLITDSLASVRELSKEILEKHPDGKLSLGELGDYELIIHDEGRDINDIKLYRDREFEGRVADTYLPVFSRDAEHNPYAALDAQETIQALHGAVFPQEQQQ